MGVPNDLATQSGSDGIVDLAIADLQGLQPVPVRNQPQAGAGLTVAVVDIDDVGD